jgi:hypothetical protein
MSDWTPSSEAQTYQVISANIKSPLSKDRVKELEAVIDVSFSAKRKYRERFLCGRQHSLEHAVRVVRDGYRNKTNLFLHRWDDYYIRLSELRRYLDIFLWKVVSSKEAKWITAESAWPKELSRSKVPTVEAILYWVLREQSFANEVTTWLDLIFSIDLSYKVGRRPKDLILFCCAVILINAVAQKAEKFMLIDDIQNCLKRFPRVYIQ